MTALRLATLLIIGTGAELASADPLHVHAEHCAALEPVALDAAVGRELALDPKLAAIAQRLTVIVECPDGLHAQVRIEPDPADGPLSRELDLSEEPAALHVKLVALAIAELVDVLVVPPPIKASVDAEAVPVARIATTSSSRHPNVTVRAGIRIFADDQDPMPSISADFDVGPVQLGIVTAIGDNHRFAGLQYIVAATVGRRLVCSHGRTSLCMVARGEAGFAGVSIRADASSMMEHSIHSGYGDLALGLEAERQFRGWKGLAGVEIGAAEGLVVEARFVEHLDGPFAVVGIGVIW